MVPEDNSHLTLEFQDHFVIKPSISFESKTDNFSTNRCSENGMPVGAGFSYCSKNNPEYLSLDTLKKNLCSLVMKIWLFLKIIRMGIHTK